MKKQILVIAMALFAATTAFGQQMIKGSDPQQLSCSPGPLTPTAGNAYDYMATETPTGGDFTWWATTDVDFIKAGANNLATRLDVATGGLTAVSDNYGLKGGPTNSNKVTITWSAATLAAAATTPTFVVVQNDAVSPGCANNLKVYQIKPITAFTVDIKNMDQAMSPLAYAAPYSFCVSNIASARYNAGAIVTDYGTNVMYFEVVAANFTGSYTPSFQLSGLQPGQTVTLELYYDAAFSTAPIPTTLNTTTGIYSPTNALLVDGSVSSTSAGVSIYVKLTIANNTYETLTNEDIKLAVNGINAVGENSVDNNDCSKASNFNDAATQTLTARPTITANTATGAFVPQ